MRRQPTDHEIVAAYEATRSVWRAAEALGIAGQTVHRRLKKIGFDQPRRPIIVESDLAIVPLTRDMVAIIDKADVALVSGLVWHAHKNRTAKTYYARANVPKSSPRKQVLMHRLLAGVGEEYEVDHADMDGLNNRRLNLRIATHSQNTANRPVLPSNQFGIKGVSFVAKSGKWHARIRRNGRLVHLGLFGAAEEAKAAYDQAAKEEFGQFARAE